MSDIHADRMNRLRAKMAATQTDLVILGPSSHMRWLTDLSPHGDERPVMLMVSQSFAGFLMPGLNADSSRVVTDLPFFTWSDDEGPDAALEKLLAATGVDRANCSVVVDETMRTDFALLALDALPGARRRFTVDTIGALRARKDESEYAALKKSALINDAAARAAFAALKPGVTELEIEKIIIDTYKAHGAELEFSLICFGANGAFPHHHTGKTMLKPDDAVLIDIGCRIDGYPSDMTRVGGIGKVPAEFDAVHAVVEQAVQAAVAAARPGARAMDVDKAARDVITAAGYGDKFLHRTGHGIGIDIHEPPYITASSTTVLEEGMCHSIEPGIYLAGAFGIRLEEIVIIRADGAEILSELPRAAVYV